MPLHPILVKTGLHHTLRRILKPFHSIYKYMLYLNFVQNHKGQGAVNDYYNNSSKYQNRYQLHDALLSKLRNKPIFYYEFGVAGGDMIKHWSSQNKEKESVFVGFDSFEGLPESWEDKYQGHFNQEGSFPNIDDSRVRFVKGWFQDSVYTEIANSDFDKQCIFHLDADLFSSTLYVLFQIQPKLKTGDILIFDEFSSHEHEFEALEIFKRCCNNKWGFEFIDAVNNFRQVAFRLK